MKAALVCRHFVSTIWIMICCAGACQQDLPLPGAFCNDRRASISTSPYPVPSSFPSSSQFPSSFQIPVPFSSTSCQSGPVVQSHSQAHRINRAPLCRQCEQGPICSRSGCMGKPHCRYMWRIAKHTAPGDHTQGGLHPHYPHCFHPASTGGLLSAAYLDMLALRLEKLSQEHKT